MASAAVIRPDAYTAAISPDEWPATAVGHMPHEASRSTRPIWIAVHTVWDINGVWMRSES
ncbi:hypothetical protein RRF57_012765 [Xylaria bambusicola]|uniref:Uncharacterized protein n=1 Tax=Xylaria bambusicola TaxID=326684 RepID=A0AAN7UZY8_9PEZI